MDVISVTKRFIFYNDNHIIRATPEVLREIMDAARADTRFYDRMYKELDTIYNKLKLNLDHGTPAPDRDNYFERVGALFGIADAMKEAHKKQLHAIQVETQCRLALGMERPNMAELYPETTIKRR